MPTHLSPHVVPDPDRRHANSELIHPALQQPSDSAWQQPDVPQLRESDNAIRTLQIAMHVLFIVLLTVSFARALSNGASLVLTGFVTLILIGVYASGLLLERRFVTTSAPRPAPERAARSGAVWIAALIVVWAGLLCLATDFVWLAFALYFLALHVARRPVSFLYVACILTLSVTALLMGQGSRPGLVVGPVMGMVVALGISWVYRQLRAENDARKQLVSELIASHDDLFAAQEALAQTQREAGVLTERTRLARDIHDTLAQSFSSILLLSRAGLAQRPDDDVLTHIEQQAQSGLTDARSVVGALTPQELDESPLASALGRLTDRLQEQTGIAAVTRTEGTPYGLPTSLDVALLRVAQSALANVRLHSQASRCAVTLSYEPDVVRLEIIDDGVGFSDADVASAPLRGSGFGLSAMRSRVTELGGDFAVESAPGDGCAVIVALPLRLTATRGESQ